MKRSVLSFRVSFLVVLFTLFLSSISFAATPQVGYPVPQIIGPTHPSAVVPGSGHFALNVYGANFVSASVVNWNGQPRTTTFISAHQLRAQISAADVASPTAGMVTVTTNSPNGPIKSSTYSQVEVHVPTTTINIGTLASYVGTGDRTMIPADISGRGHLDMVVSAVSPNNGVFGFETLLNHGDGTFIVGPPFGGNATYTIDYGAVGDFNGDGSLDVVYLAVTSIPNLYRLQMALDQGSGKFGSGAQFGYLTTLNMDIIVGDFDQDGVLDVVVNQNGFTTALYLGNGDGTFRAGSTLPISPGRLLAADFNGDGKLDLVSESARNGVIGIQEWLGNGDGTFQKAKTVVSLSAFPPQPDFYVTDLNGDGKEDIVFVDASNNIWAILGNGDGSFRKANVYAGNGGEVEVGDFNSDGKIDIIQVAAFGSDILALMLGNGDGTFAPAQNIAVSGLAGMAVNAVGDFNADGLLDFATFGNFVDVQVFLQQ